MSGRSYLFASLMVAGLWVTYLFHSHAFYAPWFYDDAPTLRGLADVQDWSSAWAFIWSGVASAIGRPLSNASYLLNFADWPTNPVGFRRTGVLLHLINALLLGWVALRIGRMVPAMRDRAELFASLLAVAWALHPLTFSANLMPVQRMTVLAGTFTLLGLLLYAIGRERLQHRETCVSGVVICSVAVGGFSVLGVLAKENGALLPFLVAVLEYSVLRRLPNKLNLGVWRLWQVGFFALPFVMLLVYVAHGWPTTMNTYAARNFSLDERLASQAVLTWQYMRQMFIPNVMQFGPFQDGVKVYSAMDVQVLISAFAWFAVVVLAWLERSRSGLLMLAVGWFWAGHLLESTILPLELSFEHRNYIPAIGPIAGLIAAGLLVRSLHFLPWVFMCLVVLSGWRVTSLWTDTLAAAEIQQTYHPRSVRAAQFVAMLYDRLGDDETTYRVIELAVERMPEASDLLATKLMLGCRANNHDVIRRSIESFHERARALDPSFALSDTLRHVKDMVLDGHCDLAPDELVQVTSDLLENPRIDANKLLKHNLHHVRADLLHASAGAEAALAELIEAFNSNPNPETAILVASMFDALGFSSDALDFLDRANEAFPMAVRRRQDGWQQQFGNMRTYLCSKTGSC